MQLLLEDIIVDFEGSERSGLIVMSINYLA